MALILWLPLVDNVDNQGVGNLPTPSYKSAGYDSNGKIGGCYYGAGIIYHLSDPNIIQNQWTLALWVKSANWSPGNDILFCKNISTSDYCQFYFSIINHQTLYIGINGASSNSNGLSYAYTFDTNTWYHLVASYDGSVVKLYVNGTLVKSQSKSSTLLTDCNNLCVCNRSTNVNGTAQTGGHTKYFNDVRIYDTALSDKEIEVLARGLVLHYPLDRNGFGQDNLLKSTPKGTDPSGYNFIQLNLTSNLQANTTYTLQLWDVNVSHSGKTDSQLGISVYWGGGNVTLFNLLGTTYFTNGHADYLVKTFTITEAQANQSQAVNAWLNIYNSVPNATGTRNGTIGRWKLEIGDKATPWTPAPTDDIYADMGLDTGIVYDVSGYKRNGTASGVTYSGDTAKYLASTSFDGIDDGVTITNLNIANILNDKCTISFWIKPNGDNGGRSVYFSAYNQVSWSIEKTAGNKLRSYWNGTPDKAINEITISDGTWQHIAITKNGTSSIKFYYNGEFKKELTDAHNALTFGTTWRLGRDTRSNDGTPYKGLMSDFRIYATALSAEAIAELYHTGASLANNGTLMTNQYVEV